MSVIAPFVAFGVIFGALALYVWLQRPLSRVAMSGGPRRYLIAIFASLSGLPAFALSGAALPQLLQPVIKGDLAISAMTVCGFVSGALVWRAIVRHQPHIDALLKDYEAANIRVGEVGAFAGNAR